MMGRSETTRNQYASAVRMWVASCVEQGTDPLHMNYDSLLEYRDDVRVELDGVAASTWNNNLSAFKSFAQTAVQRGFMDAIPESDWELLRRKDAGLHFPRVVGVDEYRRFSSVGLQGLTLEGLAGPNTTTITTPVRDALYADFLLAHGARRVEAAHLTLLDLPVRKSGRAFNVGYLPPEICKWGSGRDLRERAEWVRSLRIYHNTEWFTTVQQSQRNLRRLQQRGELLVVTEVRHRADRETVLKIENVSGGARKLLTLRKDQRRCLVATAPVMHVLGRELGMGEALQSVEKDWLIPLSVFPGTRSPMVGPDAWSGAFREANARVAFALAERGEPPPRRVTPHMLRHTFATEWLAAELERKAKSSEAFRKARDSGDSSRVRELFFQPMMQVQRLLGHRSRATTEGYIDFILREQQMVLTPEDSWIESYLGADL